MAKKKRKKSTYLDEQPMTYPGHMIDNGIQTKDSYGPCIAPPMKNKRKKNKK